MEMFTIIFLSLITWAAQIEAEIRCYCNEASCISTSYMCKSQMGACFSQLTYESNHARSVHGCVEMLPQSEQRTCGEQDGAVKTRNTPDDWPILICCHEDMCNYMEKMDINVYVDTTSNGSTLKGHAPKRRGGTSYSGGQDFRYVEEADHQRELWFKAAVIAVPIAGGFILVLLVLLAVRMLKNDSRRHRQLLQMRRHRSLAKAQLYVADHFCEKHAHAHFNAIDSCKPNALYKDVNVKIDREGRCYEKINESSTHGGSCNSIIVWGSNPNAKTDQPSVV